MELHWFSTGALCSMRRALSVKEKELLTVKTELEDLKKELKDRMTQLQAMSRKVLPTLLVHKGKYRTEQNTAGSIASEKDH